jgi:hypothetical protein
VSRANSEAIVLRSDGLVDLERHPDSFAAAAVDAALAEELHDSVRGPGLGGLAELRNPLVHLAEDRLVARLTAKSFVWITHADPE